MPLSALQPSGPSSAVVSRAAARAVAKAVRDAELRAHEEMVAAHRRRLKESGAPVMRGGRISSTPRPGKGVDWSRSQSERRHRRAGGSGTGETVGVQTERAAEGSGWENDEAAVARLTELAATLGSDAPANGVHDALAAELQRHGPLPPGVLSGLLEKGDAENGPKKTGTWPTSTPRGYHTGVARSGEPPPAIAALMDRAAAGSLTEEELTDLELSSSERLPSGWLRQIRMTIRQQRFASGGASSGGRSANGGSGVALSSGSKDRSTRLAVPRLRGPIIPRQVPTPPRGEDQADKLTEYDITSKRGQIVRAVPTYCIIGTLHRIYHALPVLCCVGQ